jgi:hypothetical protein
LGLGLNGKKKNWPFGPGNGHRPTTSPFPNFFFSSLSHPPLSLPSFSPCSFFPLPNISPPPSLQRRNDYFVPAVVHQWFSAHNAILITTTNYDQPFYQWYHSRVQSKNLFWFFMLFFIFIFLILKNKLLN